MQQGAKRAAIPAKKAATNDVVFNNSIDALLHHYIVMKFLGSLKAPFKNPLFDIGHVGDD